MDFRLTSARENGAVVEMNLEIVGFDIDNKQFGLIFKIPYNLAKYLEEFKRMLENHKQSEKSLMLNSSQPSIKSKSNLMFGQLGGGNAEGTMNTKAGELLHKKLLPAGSKDAVNKKDAETVAFFDNRKPL